MAFLFLKNASYRMKYWLRRIVRFSSYYRTAYAKAEVTCSRDQQEENFWKMLRYAVNHVPYYKRYQPYLQRKDISSIPLLYKQEIANHSENFVSDEFDHSKLLCISTGGTTGTSTNIYTSWKDEIRNTAYIDAIFYLNRNKKPIICTIREHDLQQGEFYRFFGNRLMFSPSNINKETIQQHIDWIRQYKVNILHCYPSSLLVFSKFLKEIGVKLQINKIVVSSETVPSDLYELVEEVFPNALFVNFYGQTENVARGISLNGASFQFSSQCLVEFIDTGERRGEHIIANIVGTNLEKKSMPLIRFFTGDQAILDKDGNVLEILGRTSEYLIDKVGNPIPCIVTNRPETLKNVLLAQYYQEVEGFFEYRVMVNEDFSESDVQAILEDIRLNFGEVLSCEVKVVDTMEKTPRGKHKKLIQKLDLNKYL